MKTYILLFTVLAALLSACTPTDPSMGPGPQPVGNAVYVDSAELLIMESFPVQVRLVVTGSLPTPCHVFRSEVAEADTVNNIHVTAYSEVAPEAVCAQVLEPFEESIAIPMAGAADGAYSVWLNGELVGEFSYPG